MHHNYIMRVEDKVRSLSLGNLAWAFDAEGNLVLCKSAKDLFLFAVLEEGLRLLHNCLRMIAVVDLPYTV